MKKFLFSIFSLLAGVGLLWWIINAIGWEKIKITLQTFSGWQGMMILGLTFLTIVCGTWKWKEILRSRGYNISLPRLFRPYLAGFSIMYFVPMIIFGGEIFRGHVLKEKYLVPGPKAYASVIIDRILEVTVYLAVILLGTAFFLLEIGFPPKNFVIFFGGALVFFTAAIIFFYFKTFKKESIIRIFVKKVEKNSQAAETEKEIYDFFKIKNKFMWEGLGLAWLKAAVVFIRTWILIVFLGKTTGVFTATSILGFYYLASIIPIPAALGSHDAIQAFSFNALGAGANTGAAFTMIVRGAELIMALAGLVLFLKLGLGLFCAFLLKRLRI